jgi:hypothetical protein
VDALKDNTVILHFECRSKDRMGMIVYYDTVTSLTNHITDLIKSRLPTIIGAPPPPESDFPRGRRKFSDGRSDRLGLQRLAKGNPSSIDHPEEDRGPVLRPSTKRTRQPERSAKQQTGKKLAKSVDFVVPDSDEENQSDAMDTLGVQGEDFIKASSTEDEGESEPIVLATRKRKGKPNPGRQAKTRKLAQVGDASDEDESKPADLLKGKGKPNRRRQTKTRKLVELSDTSDGGSAVPKKKEKGQIMGDVPFEGVYHYAE